MDYCTDNVDISVVPRWMEGFTTQTCMDMVITESCMLTIAGFRCEKGWSTRRLRRRLRRNFSGGTGKATGTVHRVEGGISGRGMNGTEPAGVQGKR